MPSPSEELHPCAMCFFVESHLMLCPSGPDPARGLIPSLSRGHWSRALTPTTASGPAGGHIHTLWVALTQASCSAVSPGPNQAVSHIHVPTRWVGLVPSLLLPFQAQLGSTLGDFLDFTLSETTPKMSWQPATTEPENLVSPAKTQHWVSEGLT